MIEKMPNYISIAFVSIIVITVMIVYWIIKNSNNEIVRKKATWIVLGLILWLAIQVFLTIKGLYSDSLNSIPPKILLFGVLPNIAVIFVIFLTQKGRNFIDSLSLKRITILSIVRIPIEFVLLWLFIYKAIPQSMTFEGQNFDIVMGLTAPLIIYFGFKKCIINWQGILIWNVIGILLLLNVVITGLFSAPFPLQKFAFEQPNVGLLYFPFSWLPTFIVPIVILGHLISIRQLIKLKKNAIKQCI